MERNRNDFYNLFQNKGDSNCSIEGTQTSHGDILTSDEPVTSSIAEVAQALPLNLFSPLSLDADRNTISSDYFCVTCGVSFLFTPQIMSSIRIRSLKKGKSRRRRASRLKASKLIKDREILQKHRGGGRSFAGNSVNNSHGGTVMAVENIKLSLKESHEYRRVKDGMSKNCVVYTCGFCGNKYRWKGLCKKRKELQKNCKDFYKDSHSPTLRKACTATLLESNENFLLLSKSKNSPPFKKPKYVDAKQSLDSARKKKKSQKAQVKSKKSALMDFLSSLND